jgi:hypothetical protein
MSTKLNRQVSFVGVFGGYIELLSHLIPHYRKLGVTRFIISLHGTETNDPAILKAVDVLARFGIEPYQIIVGPWNEDLNAKVIREVMQEDPEGWFLMADQDEFQIFDRDLGAVIDLCEREKADFVRGCLLDRVALDGSLAKVMPDESIWAQFPLCGSLTLPLAGAYPRKVVLARGSVHVGVGQHSATCGSALPYQQSLCQVHHFKWVDGLAQRLETRRAKFAHGEWRKMSTALEEESTRVLTHLAGNNGRIDIHDSRFYLDECGSEFNSYRNWAVVAGEIMESNLALKLRNISHQEVAS